MTGHGKAAQRPSRRNSNVVIQFCIYNVASIPYHITQMISDQVHLTVIPILYGDEYVIHL